jgi:hypothetical protein
MVDDPSPRSAEYCKRCLSQGERKHEAKRNAIEMPPA